jgi:Tfp pilus assembly PilM family ATPase
MLNISIRQNHLLFFSYSKEEEKARFIKTLKATENGHLNQREELAHQLSTFLEKHSLRSMPSTLILPNHYTTFQTIKTSKNNMDWEIYQQLCQKFDHYFQGEKADYCLDFEWLKHDHLHNQSIRVFAALKKTINDLFTSFSQAGFLVNRIGVDITAIEKTLHYLIKDKTAKKQKFLLEESIFILIEANACELIFCSRGFIQKIKKIPFEKNSNIENLIQILKENIQTHLDSCFLIDRLLINQLQSDLNNSLKLPIYSVELKFLPTEALFSKLPLLDFFVYYGSTACHGN